MAGSFSPRTEDFPMKLSRILLPAAAVAMIAAPTLASAATHVTKHHRVVKKTAKPAKIVKKTATVTKAK
jgi:hypothetical protein